MKRMNPIEIRKIVREKIDINQQSIRLFDSLLAVINKLNKKKANIKKDLYKVFKDELPNYGLAVAKGNSHWTLYIHNNRGNQWHFNLGNFGEDQIVPDEERFMELNTWMYSYSDNLQRLEEFFPSINERCKQWNTLVNLIDKHKRGIGDIPYLGEDYFQL